MTQLFEPGGLRIPREVAGTYEIEVYEHGELMGTTGPMPAVPCTCCGSYAGETLAVASPLLAVANVLVVRALEAVGKRIVRLDRSRYQRMGPRQWHEAHTIWPPPEDAAVTKALDSAWDVVPALLDEQAVGPMSATSRQVTELLDAYVRDLLITGTRHTYDEMSYRFAERLGIS